MNYTSENHGTQKRRTINTAGDLAELEFGVVIRDTVGVVAEKLSPFGADELVLAEGPGVTA